MVVKFNERTKTKIILMLQIFSFMGAGIFFALFCVARSTVGRVLIASWYDINPDLYHAHIYIIISILLFVNLIGSYASLAHIFKMVDKYIPKRDGLFRVYDECITCHNSIKPGQKQCSVCGSYQE